MTMKKTLSAIVMAAVLASASFVPATESFFSTTSVSAASTYGMACEETGNAKYYYKVESYVAVIYSVTPKTINKNGVTKITLPSNINGYYVAIAQGAFSSITDKIQVNIPSYIYEIGKGAFYNCQGLESIIIKNGCGTIAENAFYACRNLKLVDITAKHPVEIKSYAFQDCSGMTNLKLNIIDDWGEVCVRSNAFSGCSSLSELDVPGSHAGLYINEGAFNNTKLLKDNKVVKPRYIDEIYGNLPYDFEQHANKGPNYHAYGKTLNIVIFAENYRFRDFSAHEMCDYDTYLKSNYSYLKDEISKYGKTLEITSHSYLFDANDDEKYINTKATKYISGNKIEEDVFEPIKDNIIVDAIKSTGDYDYVFNDPTTINNSAYMIGLAIAKGEGYDNVVFTIVFNTHDRSNTNMYKDVILDFVSPYQELTWAHEYLHSCGARDYYYEEGKRNCYNQEYVNQHLSKDIMYNAELPCKVGWLTAISAGLTDTVLASDIEAINWY